jgi:hypothetical protein
VSAGLLGTAATLGRLVWCERRGFEILGGWAPAFTDPRLEAALDRHAAHHAWRADQLWDRLPVLAQVDRAALVGAPDGPVAAMAGVLARLDDPVGRLAGAYRVAQPRLASAYRGWLGGANPVSDGPAMRTVAMVLADLEADRAEGEDLLQVALTTSAAAYTAGFTVARLDAVLAGASPGVTGP